MRHDLPFARAGQVIGLLGGSFDPAHEGHAHITREALRRFGLDAVWWLVSPGNPLKDPKEYAPYEARLAKARIVAADPSIVISDFERRKNLRYTVDTLETLTALWPEMRFVWLMGADSLETLHHWKDWRRIFALVPVAIFNRPGHEHAAEDSPAAREFAAFRREGASARALAEAEPPAWAFFDKPAIPLSSTQLRRDKRQRH